MHDYSLVTCSDTFDVRMDPFATMNYCTVSQTDGQTDDSIMPIADRTARYCRLSVCNCLSVCDAVSCC